MKEHRRSPPRTSRKTPSHPVIATGRSTSGLPAVASIAGSQVHARWYRVRTRALNLHGSSTDRGIKAASFLHVRALSSHADGTLFARLRERLCLVDPYKHWQFQHSVPRLWTWNRRTGSNFACLGTPNAIKRLDSFAVLTYLRSVTLRPRWNTNLHHLSCSRHLSVLPHMPRRGA